MNNDGLLNKLLFLLYDFFYNIRSLFKKIGSSLFFITIIALICIFSYIFFKSNPYNILDIVHSPLILLVVFAITLFSTLLIQENDYGYYYGSIVYLKFVSTLLLTMTAFYIIFYISKNILYYGTTISYTMTIFIIMSMMAIFYKSFFSNNDSKQSGIKYNNTLLSDIIFVIPCILLDIIDYFKQDLKNTPSSTFILIIINIVLIATMYLLPYLTDLFKDHSAIYLLKNNKELNKELVFLNHNELNNKIIDNRPILQRQIIQLNNKLKNTMDLHNKPIDKQEQILNTYSTKETFSNINENFNGHFLDVLVADNNMMANFSRHEQEIIQRSIESNNSNMKVLFEKMRNEPEMLQAYIIDHFSSNENYMSLLDYINKYNNDKNIILNDKLSYLVQMINLKSGIHEYNYHYGLSFWVYFDSHILKESYSDDYGLIMDYGNQPKIYYDFNSKELKIDVMRNNSSQNVYKTNKILFQRWNHFVVNYNYGTLDIFINNNLVTSISKLEPYIQKGKNNVIFGSDENPLKHCGLSDVRYYDIPLQLSQIKSIYNDKNRTSY